MDGAAGYHRVFWLTTVFVIFVIVVALAALPSRTGSADGTIDLVWAQQVWPLSVGDASDDYSSNSWGWTAPPPSDPGVRRDRSARMVAWERRQTHPWSPPRCWPPAGAVDQSRDGVRCMVLTSGSRPQQFVQIDRATPIWFQRNGSARQRGVPAPVQWQGSSPRRSAAGSRSVRGPANPRMRSTTGIVGFLWLPLRTAAVAVIVAGIFSNGYISLATAPCCAGGQRGRRRRDGVRHRVTRSLRTVAVRSPRGGGRPPRPTVAATGMPPEHAFVTIFIRARSRPTA